MFGDFGKLFGDMMDAASGGIAFTKEWYDFRMFAIQHHGDQKYGEHPYAYHLAMVETYLKDSGFHENNYAMAAWLHDIVEDTKIQLDDIFHYYGGPVTAMVWACTGEGVNREEKNTAIYAKIAKYPQAAPVKVADRVANTYFSWKTRNLKKMKMYVAEHEEFVKNIGQFMHEDLRSSNMMVVLEGNYERCRERIEQMEAETATFKEKDGPVS